MRLESVEIDKQDSSLARIASTKCQRAFQVIEKQRSIGKFREWIVRGAMCCCDARRFQCCQVSLTLHRKTNQSRKRCIRRVRLPYANIPARRHASARTANRFIQRTRVHNHWHRRRRTTNTRQRCKSGRIVEVEFHQGDVKCRFHQDMRIEATRLLDALQGQT